jgi:hypothetical protein
MAITVHEALEDARRRLEKAQNSRASLEATIARIHDEVRGLELALMAHGGEVETEAPSRNGWAGVARTKAVEALLREIGPLTPSEISRGLRDRGRIGDKPRYVSAAIAYLKKQGVVQSVGGGKWAVVEDETAEGESPEQEALGG